MRKVRRKKYFRRSLKRSLPFLKTLGRIIFITSFVGFLYYLGFRTDLFRVDSVHVTGSGSFVNAVDVQSLVESNVLNKNVFLVDRGEIAETLLENFRGAKDFNVSIKFPNRVVVEIIERDPLALIFNDKSMDYFIIDSEGFVLGVVDETKTNLPKIRFESDIAVGEFISSDIVPVYLDLMDSLDRNEVSATSVSFYPRYVRLYVHNGIEVLIGNDKDKFESLRIVKSIIRQEELEENTPNKIDLRYDKVSVQ